MNSPATTPAPVPASVPNPAPSASPAVAGLPANGAKKTAPAPTLHSLSLGSIMASRLNPRKEFNEAEIEDLAESIKTNGVLQPIVVRKRGLASVPVDKDYEIVMGERRFRAAQEAGLKFIPAVVHEDLTDAQAVEMALVENLQRVDMNALEEAEGYAKLQQLLAKQTDKKITHDEIADRVGKSRPSVTNALRLLELPEDVRETIREGKLTAAHGVALLRYKAWPKVVQFVAKWALLNNASAGKLEEGLDYNLSWELVNKKLMLECESKYEKLAKEHPDKFLAGSRRGLVCFDVPWMNARLEAEAKAEEARDLARMEKAKKAGKETGGLLDLTKENSDRTRFVEVSELPKEMQAMLPDDAKLKAKPAAYSGKKGTVTVVSQGVANSIKGKLNKAARSKMEADAAVAWEKARAFWDGKYEQLRTLDPVNTFPVANRFAVDERSLILLSYAVLIKFRMKLEPFEKCAARAGIKLPKELKDGLHFYDDDSLPMLHKLGAPAAVRLALESFLGELWENAQAAGSFEHLVVPEELQFAVEKLPALPSQKKAPAIDDGGLTSGKYNPEKIMAAQAKAKAAALKDKPAKKGAKK